MVSKRKRKSRASQPSPESSPEPSQDTPDAATVSLSQVQEADHIRKRRKFEERYKTATESNEDVLAAQMQTWSSDVYAHFKMPPTIFEVNGDIKYRFLCKSHPNVFMTRARHEDSTSNLKKYVAKCDTTVAEGKKSIAHFAQGSTYSPAKFRYLLTLWVTTCHRPFSIVEDEPLQELFHMLYDPVQIPSASTVGRDVKEIFQISKKSVISYLAKVPGAIHVQFDGWTSPNIISFLGVVIAFEQDGALHSFTLDFIRLRKAHTGRYLARALHDCLRSYGITKKILGQICNNASNNDTMAAALQPLLDGPGGTHTRVRCFCHILNLCVKAILKQFSRTGKHSEDLNIDIDDDHDLTYIDSNDSEDAAADDNDDYEVDQDQLVSDEATLESLQDEISIIVTASERALGCFAVAKIKGLAKRVFNSPTILADLEDACKTVNIKPQRMVRSVDTRWNSVVEMLKRAFSLRSALDILVNMDSHNGPGSSRLERFALDKQEWEVLEELMPILEYFLKITRVMSQSKICLLYQVIPYFDALDRMLAADIDKTTLKPTVRAAAELGRAVLNKYYAKTDDSIMYRCAMVLHPRYKLAYFRNAEWPQEWIDAALKCVRDTWLAHYKPTEDASQPSSASQASPELDFFAAIKNFGKNANEDALEEYLNTPPVGSVTDPIKWWSKEETPLARMALDFLSTPASSTDVERAFSHGGLVVSKRRHNLSDESVRAGAVLNSWAQVPGLIPKAEIINVLHDKSKRGKKPATPIVVDPDLTDH